MSSRRKRSPEEQARREKIRELLQTGGVSSMEDIQNLFKETIAEFLENAVEKHCAPASEMLRCQCLAIGKANSIRRF